jgi:hypothetical protein
MLIFGGVALSGLGMLYGLYFALHVEHQTLDQMSGSLAQAFGSAAERNSGQCVAALQAYGKTKYDYVREVDAHSHWIGLAMVMLVLGLILERVSFSQALRRCIAGALLAGSFLFPLGVLLQSHHLGSPVGKAVAAGGACLVIAALAATAWGFARPGREFN